MIWRNSLFGQCGTTAMPDKVHLAPVYKAERSKRVAHNTYLLMYLHDKSDRLLCKRFPPPRDTAKAQTWYDRAPSWTCLLCTDLWSFLVTSSIPPCCLRLIKQTEIQESRKIIIYSASRRPPSAPNLFFHVRRNQFCAKRFFFSCQ